MTLPCWDINKLCVLQNDYLFRYQTIFLITVSKSSIQAAPPRVNNVTFSETHAMKTTRCNFFYFCLLTTHLQFFWILNIFSSAKTQSSVIAGTPTEHTTVYSEKKSMRETTADLDGGLCELRHLDWWRIANYGLLIVFVNLRVAWVWVGLWLTFWSFK